MPPGFNFAKMLRFSLSATREPVRRRLTPNRSRALKGVRHASRQASALFNPTPEHAQLRAITAAFAKDVIGPQAVAQDKIVRACG